MDKAQRTVQQYAKNRTHYEKKHHAARLHSYPQELVTPTLAEP